jgi:hypothetical protein
MHVYLFNVKQSNYVKTDVHQCKEVIRIDIWKNARDFCYESW